MYYIPRIDSLEIALLHAAPLWCTRSSVLWRTHAQSNRVNFNPHQTTSNYYWEVNVTITKKKGSHCSSMDFTYACISEDNSNKEQTTATKETHEKIKGTSHEVLVSILYYNHNHSLFMLHTIASSSTSYSTDWLHFFFYLVVVTAIFYVAPWTG